MSSLDGLLYKWIRRANERRDDLDLPIGFIEDSIALLARVLGPEYLGSLLIIDDGPVHFLDDEANPLRKWLLSAMVDAHIIQVLELAAYFSTFREDSSLSDKVEKLKRDSFWPVFFELALATRVKRASRVPQEVHLNPETSSSIGDFTISAVEYEVPCECSRLGRSPAIASPAELKERLSNHIHEQTRRITTPLCIKIRSTEALTGDTYNHVLRLLRKGLADARRLKLPSEYTDGQTTVRFEELTETSEQIPFKIVDGRVTNVLGTDWDSAERLIGVPAKHSDEITERFQQGERFHEYETVRVFTKFGAPANQPDYYHRITTKLKKKLKQTKVSGGQFGKVVLIEVPFDLRNDVERLEAAVDEAAVHSRTTCAVILANREPNPHLRYQYSQFVMANRAAVKIQPDLLELLNRMAQNEIALDPILRLPYRRSWAEAKARSKIIGERNLDKKASTGDT
jgi:hypothetical protein